MTDGGLDAEKLRLLDEWAEGLQRDDRPEVAAAGRAILLLVQEVERLHVHLWDRYLAGEGESPEAERVAEPESAPAEADEVVAESFRPDLDRSLRQRLFGRWNGASADD